MVKFELRKMQLQSALKVLDDLNKDYDVKRIKTFKRYIKSRHEEEPLLIWKLIIDSLFELENGHIDDAKDEIAYMTYNVKKCIEACDFMLSNTISDYAVMIV